MEKPKREEAMGIQTVVVTVAWSASPHSVTHLH